MSFVHLSPPSQHLLCGLSVLVGWDWTSWVHQEGWGREGLWVQEETVSRGEKPTSRTSTGPPLPAVHSLLFLPRVVQMGT